MSNRFRSLRFAAGLLVLLCVADARADQPAPGPAAGLDRILKIAAEAPAYSPEVFGSCERPTPPPDVPSFEDDIPGSYLDLWCRRCRESGDGWSAELRFFHEPEAGTCTLQQVEMTVHDGGLLDALTRHLSAAWHQESAPTPFESGDYAWERDPEGVPNGWRLTGSRAWLFKDSETIGPPYTLRFLWRQNLLVEVLRGAMQRPGSRAVLEACRQAQGNEASGCEAFAEHDCGDGDTPALEAYFRAGLTRIATTKPDEPSYSAQLYWTQRLGECTAGFAGYPDDSYSASEALNKKFPELVAANTSFVTGGWKDESVVFGSAFRALLLDKYQNDRWGRQAFLDSLLNWEEDSDGCSTSGFAPAADIIRRAEEFLQRYPETETSDEVRLTLAEAYETWWSISISGNRTGDQFPDDVPIALAGRENARQRALAIYRRLASNAGANPWLKDRIFRLEHNMDTYERGWVCSKC